MKERSEGPEIGAGAPEVGHEPGREGRSAFDLKKEFLTLLRYGAVGVVNTLTGVLAMYLLSLTGLHYSLYSPIAYGIGIALSFFLNFRFTFRMKGGGVPRVMALFIAVCLVLTGLSQIVQALLIEGLGSSELVGVGTGMVLYTGLGFVINRIFVFKPKKA